MAFLEVRNLNAFYGKAQALHDVSLSVNQGQIIALVGANGAGKSTLLDSLMGLTQMDGQVMLEGTAISGLKPAQIVRLGLGYAPERFNLFPYLSVRDNLLVGGFTARDQIEQNLDMVNALFPRLKERSHQETSTQSGGERQMVSLGRALMTNPRVLLVDEPTIGLAPKVCAEIAAVLRRLRDEFALTVIITEQNANFALDLAQEVHVMEAGRIVVSGSPAELMNNDALAEAYFGH